MTFFLTALRVFQVVFALGLIIAVMLHSAKGEGIGALGGQARIFGSQKGVEAGLNRLTAGLAVLWGLDSLVLSLLTYHKLW